MIVNEVLQHDNPRMGIARRKQLAYMVTEQAMVSVQAAKPCVRAGLSLLVLNAAL